MVQISTIVPVYKVELYLHRCVDSIITQTYTDFDLILIDDGSPDRCGSICDEYSLKDERIVVIHQKNGGFSDARNKGIELSLINVCNWTMFIDSDDWIYSGMYNIMMDQILKEGASICACEAEKTDGVSFCKTPCAVIETQKMKGIDYFIGGYSKFDCTVWGKLIKTSLIYGLRLPKGRLGEDNFFTYKLLYYADDLVYCNNKMYYYYMNPNSITHTFSIKKILDIIDAIEEQCLFFLKEEGPQHSLANQKRIAEKCKQEYVRLPDEQKLAKKEIAKRLRKVILRNIRQPNWKINKATSYYAIAFPFLTWVFRKVRYIKEMLQDVAK